MRWGRSLAVVLAACGVGIACGGSSGSGDPDGGLADGTVGGDGAIFGCVPDGQKCAGPADCCSNQCVAGSCVASQQCKNNGTVCKTNGDCCSQKCESRCDGNRCVGVACQANGAKCAQPSECCSSRCENGFCAQAGQCKATNVDCDPKAKDCCSGRCEPVQGMTNVTRCANYCVGDGAACTKAIDCCGLGCWNGKCGAPRCALQSQPCAQNADCCSNICDANTKKCQLDPQNTMCRGTGESCNSGSQMGCCSKVCSKTLDPKEDRCDLAPDVCRGESATCAKDADCCHGICDPNTHKCKTPCAPTSGACTVAGDCCSGSCCMGTCNPPPNNCTPTGQACTKPDDCCTGFCFGGFCTPGVN